VLLEELLLVVREVEWVELSEKLQGQWGGEASAVPEVSEEPSSSRELYFCYEGCIASNRQYDG
jgi:hypothetical protein